jgi:hypothetical protein
LLLGRPARIEQGMKRWALASMFLLLIACGGGTKDPESPADAESDGTEATSPESKSGADETDDSSNVRKAAGTPDAKGGPAPAGAAQSGDDATAVLELVVNDPELDPYLKLGEPGRFPLKIAGSKLPGDLKLVKATEPVQIVSGPKDKKDPVLVFTDIEISGKKATVRYRYDIENVRGSANLTKGQYGWELTNSRVTQHNQ